VARTLAYPNPAKTDLTIEVFTEAKQARLAVVDLTGKSIYQTNMESADGGFRTKINTDSMAKGIYFYNVETPNGMVAGKFIVE
jgi:hypothetical protein